jgi:hypothetical protein
VAIGNHHNCIKTQRFASFVPKLGISIWGKNNNQFIFGKETKKAYRTKTITIR